MSHFVFPWVLLLCFSYLFLRSALCQFSVNVSTVMTRPGNQILHIATANGQVFATGISVDRIGAIYRIHLEFNSTRVLAGSVISSLQDGIGTSAGVSLPNEIAIDPRPNADVLYFVDQGVMIRKVVISSGTVTTVLGNSGYCLQDVPDPVITSPANETVACNVRRMTMDMNGNLYFVDNNILRVFQVDVGIVTTLVGSFHGNPVYPYQYIDSDIGLNAYMSYPNALVLTEGGGGLWILDLDNSSSSSILHFVNLSNSSHPMVSSPLGTLFSSMCSNHVSPNSIYVIQGGSSTGTSGHIFSLDLTTYNLTFLAGNGTDESKDGIGQNASFQLPKTCKSLSATPSITEQLLITEWGSYGTSIREVSIVIQNESIVTMAPTSSSSTSTSPVASTSISNTTITGSPFPASTSALLTSTPPDLSASSTVSRFSFSKLNSFRSSTVIVTATTMLLAAAAMAN